MGDDFAFPAAPGDYWPAILGDPGGEEEPSAGVDGGVSSSGWKQVVKKSDQSKTSDVTLAADSTLLFPMEANATYRIRGRIEVSATSATPDLKYQLTGPASPIRVHLFTYAQDNVGNGFSEWFNQSDYSNTNVIFMGISFPQFLYIDATIQNGGNAGDFAFHWSQNTLSAAPTTIHAGSYLEYAKV